MSPYTPIRDLWIGRLGLPTVETNISEALGSDVTTTGDSTAVGMRKVKGFTLTFPIHGTTGDANPYTTGMRMRRQMRSMMQNATYRLNGLYVRFIFDPERNGWMVIGTGTLADADGGPTLGEFTLTLDSAYRVAALNTHRDAYRIDITDLRLTTSPIDYLGQQVNTAALFAGLTAVPLIALPVGATDPSILDVPMSVSVTPRPSADGLIPIGNARSSYGQPFGSGSANVVNGDVVSWERAEANFNLGDVVIWDRRGQFGPFGTGGAYDVAPFPGTSALQTSYGWEEIYGSDYPYNWLTAGQAMDAPVIANGVCRVRYDTSGTAAAGLIVDAWDAATSAYVEQCKVGVRNTLAAGADTTLISATVAEYTPDRAVIQVVLGIPATGTRDRVYITLQRGWLGPRFEVYSNATSATWLIVQMAAGATNTSAMKNEGTSTTGGVAFLSSASGSSTSPFVTGTVLGATGYFPGENWLAVIPQGGTHQLNLAVLTNAYTAVSQAYPLYASAGNEILIEATASTNNPADYLSAHLNFALLQTGQVAEAESIRNASGTTAQTTDATASNGFAVSDTQTAATNVTLTQATTFLAQRTYRLAARVKVGTSGATGSFLWHLGTNASSILTSTATAWTWIDLGEVTASAVNPTLTVTGYRSAGSGNIQIDRIEAALVRDYVGHQGSRDVGSVALLDQRVEIRKVTRG
jgi:hypothetical protein